MALIKNNVVKMPWEADGFLESRTKGFISAIAVYEGSKGEVAVMFEHGRAFVMFQSEDDDAPMTKTELVKAAKAAFKEEYSSYDYYEDNVVELANTGSYRENLLSAYGLGEEDGEDMVNRLKDLSSYWEEIIIAGVGAEE